MSRTLPILGKTSLVAEEEPAAATDTSVYVIDDDLSLWRCGPGGVTERVVLPGSVDPLDISCAPGGLLHVLVAGDPGSKILRAADREAAGWDEVEVATRLHRIACAPDGRIWAIDEAGGVLVLSAEDATPTYRSEREGFADEISVGGDGRVWVVSTEERFAGRVVKWLIESDGSWISLPAPSSAVKVAAAPDGVAWTINSQGAIWRLHPLGSGNFDECQADTDCNKCHFGSGLSDFARDIAVDAGGTVWALGTKHTKGGYQLLRLADKKANRFVRAVDFGGIKIAAG